jgi:CHAT domain-containing protein/Tfp pilus assembly protein PilF
MLNCRKRRVGILWLGFCILPFYGLSAQQSQTDVLGMIRFHFSQSEYDSVIKDYSEGLLLFSDRDSVAAALNLVARCFYYLGQNASSTDLYKKILAKPPRDAAVLAKLRINYSEVLIETTRYAEAIEQLNLADSLLTGIDQPSLSALCINMRGILCIRTSEYGQALEHFNLALTFAKRSGDVRRTSLILTNMATLYYYSGQYDEALKVYDDVLRIDLAANDPKDLAVDYGNIANTYLSLNDKSKSLDYYFLSKEMYSSIKDSAGLSLVLGNISHVYIGLEKYEKAEASLHEALRIARSIGDRLGEAEWQYALALINYKNRKYKRAVEGYQVAADIFLELSSSVNHALTLVEMGKCFFRLGDFTSAEKFYRKALDSLKTDEARHELWRPQFHLAQFFVSIQRNPEADSLFADAIINIESSRKDLEKELTTYFIEDERLDAYRSYVLFLIRQGRGEAAGAVLEKAKARNLSDFVKADQNNISNSVPDADMIQYFLHSESSVALVRTSAKLHIVPIGNKALINGLVMDYLTQVKRARKGNQSVKSIAAKLYNELWSPIVKTINLKSNLVIIPDESLYYLPFEILHNGQEYLAKKHSIVYAPSVKLAQDFRYKKPDNSGSLLILARSQYKTPLAGRPLLKELSYVDKEVDAIRNLFHPDASVFLNDALTDQLLSDSVLKSTRIIHVAAHGLNDPERPMQSSLLLFNADSSRVGKWTVSRIQKLHLNGQMIVLSACETSLGQLLKGEGMLGLTRAFLQAGASSVISTMWSVYDESTAEFMRVFYENLVVKKFSCAKAIQYAKIRMIDSTQWSDPVYWAPFVVWGSGN